jgi:hypothetical protein
MATQPNEAHQRMASLVKDALQGNTLQLQSTDQRIAIYQATGNLPGNRHPMSIANLTNNTQVMSIANITDAEVVIHTRLNDQSQYDIVGIDLQVPSSGLNESIRLPGPPASCDARRCRLCPITLGFQPIGRTILAEPVDRSTAPSRRSSGFFGRASTVKCIDQYFHPRSYLMTVRPSRRWPLLGLAGAEPIIYTLSLTRRHPRQGQRPKASGKGYEAPRMRRSERT